MINTIFYYADSLGFEDYKNKVNNEEISHRTIVFANEQKSIYKGGEIFGSMSKEVLKTLVETILKENPYILPMASYTTLGGVKIGDGISIDNEGRISVSESGSSGGNNGGGSGTGSGSGNNSNYAITDFSLSGETLTLRQGSLFSKTINLSGLLSNSENENCPVTVNAIQTSGTHIATITTKNGTVNIYSPTIEYDPNNPNQPLIIREDYDDTDLKAAIAALNLAISDLNNTANGESARLDGVISQLDDKIQNKVENLFATSEWWQLHYPGGNGSSSNFGLQDVEAYLQQIGMWTTDENGNTVTQWSRISQDVNSIQTQVAALRVQAGDTSAIDALESSLHQYVDIELGEAVTEIGNTYVKTDDVKAILEWMYSGLKSSSSSSKTYNQLVSAGKSNTLGSSAISEIGTEVTNINNNLSSSSWIESKVDAAIAGLKNSASSNNAKTEIFAKINANTLKADKNAEDIAGIIVAATGDSSSATIATKFANWKSGLVTTSKLNEATASLVTQNQLTSATSGLLLKSEFNNAKAELVAKNEFTAAAVTALVNGADSSVTINADHINLNGQTTFIDAVGNSLIANSAFISSIRAITVSASNSVVAGDSGKYGVVIKSVSGLGSICAGELSESYSTTHSPLEITNPTFEVFSSRNGSLLRLTRDDKVMQISGESLAIAPADDESNYTGIFSDDGIILRGDSTKNYHPVRVFASDSTIWLEDSEGTTMRMAPHIIEMLCGGANSTTSLIEIAVNSAGCYIDLQNNQTGARTRISAGLISLYDGTGNTKFITATN